MTNDSKYTYNIAKNRIIPYLNSMGIKYLDNLILTHGDSDHIRESIYLISNFKIKNIYINNGNVNYLEKEVIKIAKEKNIFIKKLKKNEIINLNGINLYSLNNNNNDENKSSIVLYANINKYKVLLTGDISKEEELKIIKEYKIKNIYILKLAHHGSNTSNDYRFLENVNPRYSVISAGYENKFKHPSIETIQNLNILKLKYLETFKYGSITFNLKNGTFYYNVP